ncbi:MAG: thermonuclease family protein [Alphaproteobacteria bacterium]
MGFAGRGGAPIRAAVLFLALLLPAPSAAAEALRQGGAGVVTEVADGDTLTIRVTETTDETPPLAQVGNSIEVRLVGIQAPKLPLGRPRFKAWPLGEDAKDVLARLAMGKDVQLAFGGASVDRNGRLLAHLYLGDGTWIQGAMLRLGQARVYTFPDNRAFVPEMLAREREARAARRGIWGERFYAVREAGALARDIGTFQLVEGRVLRVADVRGRRYLNFGADWKTDFTVTIAPGARRSFDAAGLTAEALEGRRVRVRGWIRSFNGPMIEATHPEQIEVLEE